MAKSDNIPDGYYLVQYRKHKTDKWEYKRFPEHREAYEFKNQLFGIWKESQCNINYKSYFDYNQTNVHYSMTYRVAFEIYENHGYLWVSKICANESKARDFARTFHEGASFVYRKSNDEYLECWRVTYASNPNQSNGVNYKYIEFDSKEDAQSFASMINHRSCHYKATIQHRNWFLGKLKRKFRDISQIGNRIDSRNILTFIWHLLIGILFSIMFTAVGASLCLIAWFLVNAGSHDGPEIFIFSFLVAFAPIACIAGVVIIIRSVFTLIGNIAMVIIAYKEKKPIEYSAIFD